MCSSCRSSSSRYTANALKRVICAISCGIFSSRSARSSTDVTSRPSSNSVESSSVSVAGRDGAAWGRKGCSLMLGTGDKTPDYTERSPMESLSLPLDYSAIERIIPHRYPFLLVDRIIELEPDKRIVGIKNVSLNEWYLSRSANGDAVVPPTMLTEAVAQVGAILILAKPENRERLPFFAGIERVRYRRAVHPGDVVVIEAVVVRLRSRMGLLKGVARVDGKSVIDGTMTFALSDPKRD